MVEIKRNESSNRYEATVDGRAAGFAAYEWQGRTVTFTHTVVQSEFEGDGVGSALAKHALEQSRASGQTVVPTCEFIAAYIDKHPEFKDLLAQPS